MQKKLHICLLLVLASWLLPFSAYTQTYPVTISTQLTQPSPIYLSNYANTASINSPIKVQLILNDLTIMNRQVRLKCYFQGAVSFVSNDFVVGAAPIYLEGGFPTQLTNVQLGPYFEYQNISGVNPNQYAQPLPEGIYNISFEVYDFATNKKLSKKSSVTTIIFQNEPPFLNLPANKAIIVEQNIQNILFSWTPRSINVSNVEYEFSLVEIWNTNTPIQNAFAYSPPLYTITTRNTTVQYSIAEPQLIPGKTYAWRVKAKALVGAEEIGVFKNNGYSEIFSFKYLSLCNSPMAITTTNVSQDQAKVTWSGAVDNYDYQVNYREKNADSKWYKQVTPREYITISNLKPKTTYEYTVGAACDPGEYTHSNIQEFTTLAQDEIAFVGCGIKPDPAALSNKTPLPALFPNDVVTAGDFPIVVLKSTGSNGTFSGEGYVTLPFLEKFRELIDAASALAGSDKNGDSKMNIGKYTRIRITFNNIGVNTDFKLISGEIIASYAPKWGGMVDLDPVLNPIIDAIGDLFDDLYDLLKKKEEGTITDVQFAEQRLILLTNIQNQYDELLKQPDLPPDLKKKIQDVKPVLLGLASTDWLAKGNTTKENIDKIASVYKEVSTFISKQCEDNLKNIITFLSTEKVSYLKLLASESGKAISVTNTNKTYTTSIYDEGNGDLKITHYKNWSVSNPVQSLFLIQTKDATLNGQGIKNFWLSYVPNNVDGYTSTIDCKVYFKDPVPDEQEPFCTANTTIPKGISAGAQFADAMGQMVFYGSIGVVSAEILGGIKASQCGLGFSMDVGLQMGINAIIKTYLNEKFSTSQLVREVSLPSATVSCATAALLNDCGTKCAGLSGFTVGFGDDILNQLKSGKSLTEVEISQSILNGIKQGILNIIISKAIGFGVNKFVTWKGKYTAKQVEDALEDFELHPEKYGVTIENVAGDGIMLGTKIDDKIKILPLEKLFGNQASTFSDSKYVIGETIEDIFTYRRFGGNAKLGGSYVSTTEKLSRSELALVEEFNNSMRFEAVIKIPKGEKLALGSVGPWPPKAPEFMGGADQIIISKYNYPENVWVQSIKDFKTGTIYSYGEFRLKFPNLCAK